MLRLNRSKFLSALSAAILLGGSAGIIAAADRTREVVPVSLNAGQSYVIKNLDQDTTPAVHVVKNPNALIVHSGVPGELVLMGADRGEWKIDVTNTDGALLTYQVEVHAIVNFTNPSEPGKAPAAPGNPLSPTAASFASATSLDAGSGPVDDLVASAAGVPGASTGGPASATPASASKASAIKLADYVPPSTAPLSAPLEAAPGPVIPSQAATMPPHSPVRLFKTDPLVAPSSPSEEGPSGSNFLPNDAVILMSGSSRIFDFPHRIRRISLANTEIADIQVVNPYQINLIGHKEGFTTLAIWDSQGRYEERQIRVDPFGRQQVLLNVIVAELNRGRTEQDGINWATAIQRSGLTFFNNLTGGPATPVGATSVTANGSQGVAPGGFMPFGGQLLPLTLSNNLTYGIAASTGNYNINAFFGYLEEHDLGKVLAEPRLLANSGELAEFLDGGEIPIVITQALNSTIVFKQFGTSVKFVPTVVGKDEIELLVRPEVSQPNFSAGLNLFGFTVPAFVTRRAKTVVRLRNNQTLIIAGLILRTPTSTVNKVPYLGDLPWIGNAFKNTQYTNQESDLMMTVTPQIVEPVPNGGDVVQPTSYGPMTDDDIRTERLATPDASRPRF